MMVVMEVMINVRVGKRSLEIKRDEEEEDDILQILE